MKNLNIVLLVIIANFFSNHAMAIEINQQYKTEWRDISTVEFHTDAMNEVLDKVMSKYDCYGVKIKLEDKVNPVVSGWGNVKKLGTMVFRYHTSCKNSELKGFRFRIAINDMSDERNNSRLDVKLTTSRGVTVNSYCFRNNSGPFPAWADVMKCKNEFSENESDFSVAHEGEN